MNYQDIHLEDKALWNQLQTAWEQGDYTTALNVLKNASLADKQLNAAAINAITAELTRLQNQKDTGFKQDKIVVSAEPPANLADGKIYFHLIGEVTDYNIPNAYYIEVHQKATGAGNYNKFNLSTRADTTALTEGTANKLGIFGIEYTLDKAISDVIQLLKQIQTTT